MYRLIKEYNMNSIRKFIGYLTCWMCDYKYQSTDHLFLDWPRLYRTGFNILGRSVLSGIPLKDYK